MNEDFKTPYFFNISNFDFKEIFQGVSFPWEVIPVITSFIEKLFSDGIIRPNYKNRTDVYVGPNTVIHESVEIAGPALIGDNCRIDHASLLREGCIMGRNVHIGHAVEVKHSLILDNSTLAHLNYIGDSVVGNSVNISGGAIIANLRLDKQDISIKTPQGRINTNLQKFGAAIGDNSVIGVNSVINPGTLLGKNSIVYPLKSIVGFYINNGSEK